MYQRNRYDLVVTTKEDEKDKILNPTESCQLVSGKTYTYVNNIVLNFTLEHKKVNYPLIQPQTPDRKRRQSGQAELRFRKCYSNSR